MRKALAVGVVGLGLLAGCTSNEQQVAPGYFYLKQTAASAAAVNKALVSCKLEAVQAVPANVQTTSTPTYTSPVNCSSGYNGQINCYGGYTSGGQVSSYDVNSDLRDKVITQCYNNSGIVSATVPACPKKDVHQDRYKYNISALDILVIEHTNRTLSGVTQPPLVDTCIEPGGEYSIINNAKTNSLLAYYKNWSEMNSEMDLTIKEVFRKQFRATRTPAAIKLSVFAVEAEIKFCTGQTDEQDFLEYIGQHWELIGLEKSSDEIEAMFDTSSLYKNTCVLGDATKSHKGWDQT